ncbi:galactose ABC transporter substrate-binding protein [Clostridium beijerinckii]|uniref:D-galactose/methyl-galactoside binding periplasmic protein MglB n=1 Tax=Clostridium beijerinckii TaxID=1520 RepID=A0AAE5H2C7_CLOBE|nr:galactose ABC transporter substrate-binding protein [Clostridium beijerinckii]NSB12828.1 methyl-galactoside transport system substrate-binding protein [Clostridium beijerinckii]OCA98203.1 galactose ABC transporter substrate-binding protein [Clostridium beijerinckii]OOM24827.1 D-galactose-binding periplasmic protein precursor [Clostridium beijerinckii]
MSKKITTIIIIMIAAAMLISINQSNIMASSGIAEGRPIKAAVLLYRFDDAYISLVRENLEKIQKENEGNIEFIFYDGKNDQSIQDKDINNLIEKQDVDLLLVNLVQTTSTQSVINKVKGINIPVILFNREPVAIDSIRSYNKACYIGTEAEEAGLLQGKVIINAWNKNKTAMDKNKDEILQYVMLMGEQNNLEAIKRTEYSILKINNSGIKTQEVALRVCDWNEEEARNVTKTLLLQYGNKIEAIIANNDSMAIGAIKALQEYGYNKGGKTPNIAVVGVDAIPEAQELIKQGIMTGSVLQDPYELAKALYSVGINLVSNKNPLYDTEYKFDQTGVSIRLPYHEYMGK